MKIFLVCVSCAALAAASPAQMQEYGAAPPIPGARPFHEPGLKYTLSIPPGAKAMSEQEILDYDANFGEGNHHIAKGYKLVGKSGDPSLILIAHWAQRMEPNAISEFFTVMEDSSRKPADDPHLQNARITFDRLKGCALQEADFNTDSGVSLKYIRFLAVGAEGIVTVIACAPAPDFPALGQTLKNCAASLKFDADSDFHVAQTRTPYTPPRNQSSSRSSGAAIRSGAVVLAIVLGGIIRLISWLRNR